MDFTKASFLTDYVFCISWVLTSIIPNAYGQWGQWRAPRWVWPIWSLSKLAAHYCVKCHYEDQTLAGFFIIIIIIYINWPPNSSGLCSVHRTPWATNQPTMLSHRVLCKFRKLSMIQLILNKHIVHNIRHQFCICANIAACLCLEWGASPFDCMPGDL